MKKFESIFTFVVSLIAFIAIIVIIFIGIKNKEEGSGSTVQEEVTKIETGTFNKVHISLENSNIQVLDSVDDTIKIVYFEREANTYTYSAEECFLQLTEHSRFSLFSCQGFNFRTETAKLYLPVGWEGMLKIEATNGSLKLENRIGLKRLAMYSTNGTIVLTNADVSEYVDLDTTNGSIEVNGVKASRYIKMETTNGSIEIDDVETAEYISAETTNGKIDCTKVVSEELEFDTTNGDIDVNNATFKNLKADTTNSGIHVIIRGIQEDFNIEMNTVNGSVYLNGEKVSKGTISTGKEKDITLITTNGSVKLNFVE